MKTKWRSDFTRALAASFVIFAFATSGTSNGIAKDKKESTVAPRIWTTKDGKHKVEAELVSHSPVDVTLKLKNGTKKTVKLSLMSDADIEHLKDYPNLKGQADRNNLPRVRIEAKKKSKKTSSANKSFVQTERFAEVKISTTGKEQLELEVLQGFLFDHLMKDDKGKTRREITGNDLIASGFKTKDHELDNENEIKFNTTSIFNSRTNNEGVSAEKGCFIVQVYWKGQLLEGWASESSRRDDARDPTLLQKYMRPNLK